jgi:hypothetical protein
MLESKVFEKFDIEAQQRKDLEKRILNVIE